MSELEKELFALEQELQTASVRGSGDVVGALLTEDFCEVGGSGTAYSKSEIVAALAGEEATEISMSEFAVAVLAGGVALVTYRARVRRRGVNVDSLRSSVWVLEEVGWRMRFHQGTRVGGDNPRSLAMMPRGGLGHP